MLKKSIHTLTKIARLLGKACISPYVCRLFISGHVCVYIINTSLRGASRLWWLKCVSSNHQFRISFSNSGSQPQSNSHWCAAIVAWRSRSCSAIKHSVDQLEVLWFCACTKAANTLAEPASEHSDVPALTKNKHPHVLPRHVCMHTCTLTSSIFLTSRCICMQTAHFETIWSHGGGLPSLLLCLVRILPGRNGNFILQGLILAPASGKFLLNDHKLRKGKEFV